MPSVELIGFSATFTKDGNDENGNNHFGENYLAAGYVGSPQAYLHTWIQLANTAQWNKIPAGAKITSAKLSIPVWRNYNDSNANDLTCMAVSGSWSPQNITHNNRPTGLYTWLEQRFTARVGSNATIDVTEWAKRARTDASLRSSGVRLFQAGDQGGQRRTDFRKGISMTVWYENPAVATIQASAGSDGITVRGTGASSASRVLVRASSQGPSGPWRNVGDAKINGDNWSIVDDADGPAPDSVSFSAPKVDGRDVTLEWSAATQTSERRHYQAKLDLSDGSQSDWSSTAQAVVSPDFSNYVLQRNIADVGKPVNFSTIYNGKNRFYTDRNLDVGRVHNYRVMSKNSDGNTSPPTPVNVRLSRPEAPSLDSVGISSDGKHFLLGGSGFESTAKVNIYVSANANNFPEKPTETFSPNATSFSREIYVQPPGPDAVVFDSVSTSEGLIIVRWKAGTNASITRYFKISFTEDGVESFHSTVRGQTMTPKVSLYSLVRSVRGQNPKTVLDNKNQLQGTDSILEGLPIGVDATYTITQTNDHGLSSSTSRTFKTAPPDAPLISTPKTVESEGLPAIEVSGRGQSGASKLLVEEQASAGWVQLGEAQLLNPSDDPTKTLPDWKFVYTPQLQRPDRVVFGESRAEPSGVHLSWTTPDSTAQSFRYRARRVRNDYNGSYSLETGITIEPHIVSYRLQKREKPPVGQESSPTYAWTNVIDDLGRLQSGSVLRFHDTFAEVGKVYDYRIAATNNWNLTSTYSVVRSVSMVNPPPAPPDETGPAPEPVVTDPQPTGVTDISNVQREDSTLRFSWDYDDGDSFLAVTYRQNSYRLKVEYQDEAGLPLTRFWHAGQKAYVETSTDNASSNPHADLAASIFRSGQVYTFTLSVESENGERSEDLVWTVEPSIQITTRFDTLRRVATNVETIFDTYRKVDSIEEGQVEYVAKLSWFVQPNLPMVVDDGLWEGGGNTWLWTVIDNDGRPEPNATIDLEKPGYRKTFASDSRGRFALKIGSTPGDDVEAGVYTLRERGDSMASRTTYDFPVVDQWTVYNHGGRHAANGPDPVHGLTKDQFAPNAGILPSQIEGGESLGEIVAEYGDRIKEGLEAHVSRGHANFVVDGFDSFVTGAEFFVRGGVCWENGSLRRLESSSRELGYVANAFDFQVYVLFGQMRFERRADAPPGSCPVASVKVLPSGELEATDKRLSHPPFQTVDHEIVPVRWGASSTRDILHNDRPLGEFLDEQTELVRERRAEEAKLERAFTDDVLKVERQIARESTERNLVRKAALSLSFSSNLRYLYSLMRSEDLSPPTNPKYPEFSRSNASMSAFRAEDDFSSLTNLKIAGGIATLPDGWVAGFRYRLRTLRIPVPESYMLQFALVFEERGQDFSVRGALGKDGIFIPEAMSEVFTIRDEVTFERPVSERVLEGTIDAGRIEKIVERERRTLVTKVYQVAFPNSGDEAIIDLSVVGGHLGNGCQIRGFFVGAA